jgi:hypothetical protein
MNGSIVIVIREGRGVKFALREGLGKIIIMVVPITGLRVNKFINGESEEEEKKKGKRAFGIFGGKVN